MKLDYIGSNPARGLTLGQHRTQDAALRMASSSTSSLDMRLGFILAYAVKERGVEIR